MAGKKKLHTYNVPFKAVVEGTVEIRAESLDAAFEEAKTVKFDDTIEVKGEIWDASFDVNGVYLLE